jgi:hypothetical protein
MVESYTSNHNRAETSISGAQEYGGIVQMLAMFKS